MLIDNDADAHDCDNDDDDADFDDNDDADEDDVEDNINFPSPSSQFLLSQSWQELQEPCNTQIWFCWWTFELEIEILFW